MPLCLRLVLYKLCAAQNDTWSMIVATIGRYRREGPRVAQGAPFGVAGSFEPPLL